MPPRCPRPRRTHGEAPGSPPCSPPGMFDVPIVTPPGFPAVPVRSGPARFGAGAGRPSQRRPGGARLDEVELLLLDHHGLHVGEDAVGDLDRHHARAHGLDPLLEVDLAAIDLDATGLLDRVNDVL